MRGRSETSAFRRPAPHPNPLPRVQGRGNKVTDRGATKPDVKLTTMNNMRKVYLRFSFLAVAATIAATFIARAADRPAAGRAASEPASKTPVATPPAAPGYGEIAQPFIEQNCMTCHGPKKAKAGFRIDLIGADFSAPKVAEQWKEVIDRINAGEMPPEGKPRPDAKQAAAVVAWANARLHEVELAARSAGGRIVMRRLNRDEYANTVSDLLKIDKKIVSPIAEELPGDGKAEGFDRLGVALFFDQTQIERSLAVAEKIALKAIVTEPPKVNHLLNTFGELRHRPPPAMIDVFPSSKHMVPAGAGIGSSSRTLSNLSRAIPLIRRSMMGGGSSTITVSGTSSSRMATTVFASRRKWTTAAARRQTSFACNMGWIRRFLPRPR